MRRVEDQCWSIRERIGVAWQLALEQPWEQPVAGRLRTTACCTNLCWARSSPQPVSSSSAQPAGGLAPPAGEVRRTEIVRLRWFWWYERGEGWGGGGIGGGGGIKLREGGLWQLQLQVREVGTVWQDEGSGIGNREWYTSRGWMVRSTACFFTFSPHLWIISPPPPPSWFNLEIQGIGSKICEHLSKSPPTVVLRNATWQFQSHGGLGAQFGEDANRRGANIRACANSVMLEHNWAQVFVRLGVASYVPFLLFGTLLIMVKKFATHNKIVGNRRS